MSDVDLVRAIAKAIVETVKECQGQGPVPEGSVYLALQTFGLSHHDYSIIVGALVRGGKLRRGPLPHTLEAP